MEHVTEQPTSFYDEVGGAETFQTIVSTFYQLVRDDEILRPLYPEDDLDGAEERLRMFLEQYWGGPPRTYSDLRGHPRLRMRHAPRSRWVRSNATPGCAACTPPSPRSTHAPSTTHTARCS